MDATYRDERFDGRCRSRRRTKAAHTHGAKATPCSGPSRKCRSGSLRTGISYRARGNDRRRSPAQARKGRLRSIRTDRYPGCLQAPRDTERKLCGTPARHCAGYRAGPPFLRGVSLDPFGPHRYRAPGSERLSIPAPLRTEGDGIAPSARSRSCAHILCGIA